jgi:hypothetical protein
MTNPIYNKIKEIIASTPLDIYSEENETVNESNFELVHSRFEKDTGSKEDRYVGSANLFLAATLVCYDYYECESIDELSDEELEDFQHIWRGLLNKLKQDRFIREIGLLSKNNIKVVVDNT